MPDRRAAYNIRSLPITEAAALQVSKLPMLHKDPFDRLLVAQALIDGLIILTPDEAITQYPARVLW